jgi:hypothetical protein
MGVVLVILAIFAAWYFGLFEAVRGYTYRAEVGYHQGTEQLWFVGGDKSRDECTSEAIGRYNALNAQSPGRAFSWACRKMQGDRFLERVR